MFKIDHDVNVKAQLPQQITRLFNEINQKSISLSLSLYIYIYINLEDKVIMEFLPKIY